MIIRNSMIKEFIILRPADFPYRIMSLRNYFYNDHHSLNFVSAAGMNLLYAQEKICYLVAHNEYYQLLKLQNTQEPHLSKYNWLVLKGIFGITPEIEAGLEIENRETLTELEWQSMFIKKYFRLHRMLEPNDELAVVDEKNPSLFHHFKCNDVLKTQDDFLHTINVNYLNSYNNIYSIINLWFNEENKLTPLS